MLHITINVIVGVRIVLCRYSHALKSTLLKIQAVENLHVDGTGFQRVCL